VQTLRARDASTAVQPAVAVVIPTRNRFTFLAEAIESVRRQTSGDWEVVIVDDASDDGSVAKTQRLVAEDGRMRLVALEQHAERSRARNTGLAAASARYVLFLDDDDRLLPNALETLVAALDADPEASVAIGARRAFDTGGQARRAPHPRFRVRRTLVEELLLGWLSAWVAVPGQCLLRTDQLRAVGGWNETLVGPEDQELLLRLTSAAPAILVPGAVLEYRLHANQWRPPDVREQEDAFRRELALGLGDVGFDSSALLRAGELLRAGDEAYDRADYRAAVRLLGAAVRVSPRLLRSPVVAPTFLHLYAKATAGAILGSTGAGLVRDARGRCRRLLRRAPEAHVVVLNEMPQLPGRTGGYRAAAKPAADAAGVADRAS
jgi:glycosyltransferase involved in cell wall biosynthesis